MRPCRLLLPLAMTVSLLGCSESPETLKSALAKAIEAQDAKAIVKLVDLRGAPAMAHFMVYRLAEGCDGEMVCTVSLAPIDAAWQTRNAEQAAQQGLEAAQPPEGLIKIEGKSRDPAGTGKMTSTLPYAKIDGHYRVVGMRYTAAKRAELEGTSAQAQAETTLARGIPDAPGTFDLNAQWKDQAQPLPADGGEIGAAYLANVKAKWDAAAANDPDKATAATGEWGVAVLGPKEFDGKERPLAKRQQILASQALRWERDATVLGGWVKDDMAVLVVEGHNGVGNIVRGAQLMQRADGKWDTGSADLLEIPAP